MAREEIGLQPHSKVKLRHVQQDFDMISSEVFLFSPFSLARENLCCQGRFEREKIVQVTLRHLESCHVASTSSLFPGLLNHIMLQASRDWIVLDCAAAKQQKKMLQNLMHLPTAEQYLHQVNIMVLKLDLRMLLYFFLENYL